MRILHTSDWHLGRQFHGLNLLEEQAYLLDRLIALTKEAKTDVVAISGDIYDRSVPPALAVQLLNEALTRLIHSCGQRVILIAGNHDSAERLGFGQSLLDRQGLYITGPLAAQTAPVLLEDDYGPVYFAPLTYAEPLVAREVLKTPAQDGTPDQQAHQEQGEQPIRTHQEVLQRQVQLMKAQIPQGARSFALAHVFLSGAQTSDSEQPLSIGTATTVSKEVFAPFTYTALGHLHMCQLCGSNIGYSGSLMKYSFNEVNQKKGVHIVELDAKGLAGIETIPLVPRHQLACLKGSFRELLEKPQLDLAQNFLQVTLTDEAPILDVKNRLEAVYPHILQLQYERLQPKRGQALTQAAARPRLGPYQLFANFFSQINDRPLNAEEDRLIKTLLDDQEAQAREVQL